MIQIPSRAANDAANDVYTGEDMRNTGGEPGMFLHTFLHPFCNTGGTGMFLVGDVLVGVNGRLVLRTASPPNIIPSRGLGGFKLVPNVAI